MERAAKSATWPVFHSGASAEITRPRFKAALKEAAKESGKVEVQPGIGPTGLVLSWPCPVKAENVRTWITRNTPMTRTDFHVALIDFHVDHGASAVSAGAAETSGASAVSAGAPETGSGEAPWAVSAELSHTPPRTGVSLSPWGLRPSVAPLKVLNWMLGSFPPAVPTLKPVVLGLKVQGKTGPLYDGRVGDQPVTVKVWEEDAFRLNRFVPQALAEVEILAALGSHANLVPLWEIGMETRGLLCFIFPPYARTWADEEPGISQDECIFLALNVARGLRHIHRHGLIHTDIKDTAVFLDGPIRPTGCDTSTREGLLTLGRWLLQLPKERTVRIGECAVALASDPAHRSGSYPCKPQKEHFIDFNQFGVKLKIVFGNWKICSDAPNTAGLDRGFGRGFLKRVGQRFFGPKFKFFKFKFRHKLSF